MPTVSGGQNSAHLVTWHSQGSALSQGSDFLLSSSSSSFYSSISPFSLLCTFPLLPALSPEASDSTAGKSLQTGLKLL